MMYEQQQMTMNGDHRVLDWRKKNTERRKAAVVEEDRRDEQNIVVDLSGMSLETLPNPSLDLATIWKLDLSNNDLQSIPESLTARMLNLAVLDAHSNQLKSLPNSIGCLSKLKVLNVSGNLLESLPRTIENCRSLEELNANFNKLTRLPDTIGFELIHLKKLSVNSNKLIFLPISTSHLTSLKTLDARLNNLRSLPEDLENLINLETLNVSQNFQYLETLPYSIGLLMSLVELDVSYNKITALPNSMGCLRKLQKLCVEGNPLVSPPMEVVERGLIMVKEFLSEKMTAGHKSPQKKKSWVGKLVKYGTFNGRIGLRKERDGFTMLGNDHDHSFDGLASPIYTRNSPKYTGNHSVDGLASPRYMRIFSPRRLFSSSPKN